MAYVVTDACILCKFTDCVEVCPVECFHEGENMLVIDPDECIDCGVCEAECPAHAIVSEDELPPEQSYFSRINREYSQIWPSLRASKERLPEADYHIDQTGKFVYFSAKPGPGG